MGVRGQHNIKITKFAVGTPKIDFGVVNKQSKITSPFDFDLDNITFCNIDDINFNESYIDQDNIITHKESAVYKHILDTLKKDISDNLPYIGQVLRQARSILNECNCMNGTTRNSYPLRGYKNLTDTLVELNLLNHEGRKFFLTKLGKDFLDLYSKTANYIPFDWDTFAVKDFWSNPNKYMQQYFFQRYIDINGERYVMNSSDWNVNLHLAIADEGLDFPEGIYKTPQWLKINEVNKANQLKEILESMKKANVGLSPVANDEAYSIMVGLPSDNNPLFVKVHNDYLAYIYNAYNKDNVKFVLDTEKLHEQLTAFVHVIKDDKVILSMEAEISNGKRISKSIHVMLSNVKKMKEFGW